MVGSLSVAFSSLRERNNLNSMLEVFADQVSEREFPGDVYPRSKIAM